MPRPSEPPDPKGIPKVPRASDAVCAVRLQTARVRRMELLLEELLEEVNGPIGNAVYLKDAIALLTAARNTLIFYRNPYLGDAT